MTNKTITMSRELADELLVACSSMGWTVAEKLRVLLAAPVVAAATCAQCKASTADICNQNGCGYLESGNGAPVVERQEPVAWGTMQPEFSDDDRTLITDKDDAEVYDRQCYTLTPLYTSPPAPVAVRKLEMANVVRAHMEIPNCPVLTSNQCHALAVKLNACLDKVKELNQ